MEQDREVIEALRRITDKHRRWSFWKVYARLRLEGYRWNHKRVYRVYCQLGLNHKRQTKRRFPARVRQSLEVLPVGNAVWALDFMSDALYVGRRFRTLNVLDEGMRECLTIEIDTSLVVRALNQLCSWRGVPQAIRCDTGPELTSQVFIDWCNIKTSRSATSSRANPIKTH